MITHLGIIILIISVYEFLNFIKFIQILKKNISFYTKIINLLKYKNVSDNWKEKAILNYSKNLFITSVKIIFILITILLLIIIFNQVIDDFYIFLLSGIGIIETTILFLIYFYLRKKIYAKL